MKVISGKNNCINLFLALLLLLLITPMQYLHAADNNKEENRNETILEAVIVKSDVLQTEDEMRGEAGA